MVVSKILPIIQKKTYFTCDVFFLFHVHFSCHNFFVVVVVVVLSMFILHFFVFIQQFDYAKYLSSVYFLFECVSALCPYLKTKTNFVSKWIYIVLCESYVAHFAHVLLYCVTLSSHRKYVKYFQSCFLR